MQLESKDKICVQKSAGEISLKLTTFGSLRVREADIERILSQCFDGLK
jgi:hypothetical protein